MLYIVLFVISFIKGKLYCHIFVIVFVSKHSLACTYCIIVVSGILICMELFWKLFSFYLGFAILFCIPNDLCIYYICCNSASSNKFGFCCTTNRHITVTRQQITTYNLKSPQMPNFTFKFTKGFEIFSQSSLLDTLSCNDLNKLVMTKIDQDNCYIQCNFETL